MAPQEARGKEGTGSCEGARAAALGTESLCSRRVCVEFVELVGTHA